MSPSLSELLEFPAGERAELAMALRESLSEESFPSFTREQAGAALELARTMTEVHAT